MCFSFIFDTLGSNSETLKSSRSTQKTKKTEEISDEKEVLDAVTRSPDKA